MVGNRSGRVLQLGEGKGFRFALGNRGEVKADGSTGLRFGLMHTILPVGTGMPFLHVHRSLDEAFQILSGDVEYRLRDAYFIARGGATVLVPAGVPHCFRAVSGAGAAVLLIASPADGIDMIIELSRSGLGDPEQMAAILARYDTELLERHPHWPRAATS